MKKLTVSALFVILIGSWTSAQAVFITTASGDTYDITTDVGTLIDTLDDQPWWGNSPLAMELRDRLGLQLGTFPFSQRSAGPLFAFSTIGAVWCEDGTPCSIGPGIQLTGGGDWDSVQSNNQFTFAIGTLVTTVPEPTTLSLIGLGIAGLGFRRKAA